MRRSLYIYLKLVSLLIAHKEEEVGDVDRFVVQYLHVVRTAKQAQNNSRAGVERLGELWFCFSREKAETSNSAPRGVQPSLETFVVTNSCLTSEDGTVPSLLQ
jgi:hypothetical protein